MVEADEISPEILRTAGELRLLLGRIVRRLRQVHKPDELTLSQLSVLGRLERDGPATPGALAEGERVRPQGMGVTLGVLEERGLVMRRPDPTDGRRVLMSVTPVGRELTLGMRRGNAEQIGRVLAEEFTRAEQEQLAAVLPLLDRLARKL